MTLLASFRGSRPATRWSVTVACGAVLAISGCQRPEAPQVASAAPQGQAAAAPTASAGDGVQAELATYLAGRQKWVDCMRKNKIELSDPDAKGDVISPYKPGDPKADKGPESSKAANACRELAVYPSAELSEHLRPALTPAQVEAYKNFAVCMRENGVTDFGDPTPGRKDMPPIMGPGGATKSYLKAQDTCFGTAEMKSAFPGWSPGSGVG